MVKSNEYKTNIIANVVCTYFDKKIEEVFVKKRDRDLVSVRQVFHHFACKFNCGSLEYIGNFMDLGLDHATVLHSKKVVSDRLDTEKGFDKVILEINNKLVKLLKNDFVIIDVVDFIKKVKNCKTQEDMDKILLKTLILSYE